MAELALSTSGFTPEGKAVIHGLFPLRDTFGLPCEVIFKEAALRGYMVDWFGFYGDARRAGWRHNTVISEFREAIPFAYDAETMEHVCEALELLHSIMPQKLR